MHLPGRKTNSLFVGSALLEGFIKELTTDGVMPPLDSLSVFVAYAMAKEFDINLNHGFNLELAAQEWKTWCAQLSAPSPLLLLSTPSPLLLLSTPLLLHACRMISNETRKKGTIVTIVKKYLEKKKAERDARRV